MPCFLRGLSEVFPSQSVTSVAVEGGAPVSLGPCPEGCNSKGGPAVSSQCHVL